MRRAVFALFLLAACSGKVENPPVEKVVEKPKTDDTEYVAKCRKKGEEFFSAMGFIGSTPSCYKSKNDGVICQLPETSKRVVHVIVCNTDGCSYRGPTEF